MPIFFFNDTATTEIYTLSLHDALPIWRRGGGGQRGAELLEVKTDETERSLRVEDGQEQVSPSFRRCRSQEERSEEHTSELQSRQYLVCRLLLEKKKNVFLRQPARYRAG